MGRNNIIKINKFCRITPAHVNAFIILLEIHFGVY